MNYRYRVDDADIILSPEEDGIVKDSVKSGKSIVYLRNGALMINMSFVRYIKETEKPTELQEQKIEDSLKITTPDEKEHRERISSFIKTNHNEYYERLGWTHDNCEHGLAKP